MGKTRHSKKGVVPPALYQWLRKPGDPKITGAGKLRGVLNLSGLLREIITEPAYRIEKVKAYADELGLSSQRTTIGAVLVTKMITIAMESGQGAVLKEIFDRTEGKVADVVAHLGGRGKLSQLTDEQLLAVAKGELSGVEVGELG